MALLAATWRAAEACFIRAGVANEVAEADHRKHYQLAGLDCDELMWCR